MFKYIRLFYIRQHCRHWVNITWLTIYISIYQSILLFILVWLIANTLNLLLYTSNYVTENVIISIRLLLNICVNFRGFTYQQICRDNRSTLVQNKFSINLSGLFISQTMHYSQRCHKQFQQHNTNIVFNKFC